MIDPIIKGAIEAKIAKQTTHGLTMTQTATIIGDSLSDELKAQFDMFGGLAPSTLNQAVPEIGDVADGSFGALVKAAAPSSCELDGMRLVARLAFGLEDRPATHWALAAIEAIQRPHLEANMTITALLARVAFITPEANIPVYDLLAAAWEAGKAATHLHTIDWAPLFSKTLDEVRSELNITVPALPDHDALTEAETLVLADADWSEGLAEGIWAIIEDLENNAGNAGLITMNVAALGGHYSPELMQATARTLRRFPGMSEAMAAGHPADIDIDTLKDYQLGTLGHSFYRLITDNNFSVEVLDYEGMGQEEAGNIPEEVQFTSKRILQCHDLWHLTANYHVTPMHEISISGFQLGQFGQNYSAAFLAVIQLISTFTMPIGTTMLSDLTFEGWRHARQTPPMLGINWHNHWGKSIDEVRAELGITPYKSAHDDGMMPNQVPVHHATFDTFDQPIAAE